MKDLMDILAECVFFDLYDCGDGFLYFGVGIAAATAVVSIWAWRRGRG